MTIPPAPIIWYVKRNKSNGTLKKANDPVEVTAAAAFLATLLFSAGFYEYSAMLSGMLLSIGLMFIFVKKQISAGAFRFYTADGKPWPRWSFIIPLVRSG